jgi:hypothetical protein
MLVHWAAMQAACKAVGCVRAMCKQAARSCVAGPQWIRPNGLEVFSIFLFRFKLLQVVIFLQI